MQIDILGIDIMGVDILGIDIVALPLMNVLITCKYEEDPIKNRGARVFTTLYVNFSDAQGRITQESAVVSC